jgi:cell division protein FtsQ
VGARDAEDSGPLRRWRLVRAGTDAVPSSVRKFMRRARQRRLRAAAPLGVIAVVALVIGVLGWLVFVSPVLGVKRVEVTGVLVLTEEQIRAAAAVPLDLPLTRVDVAEVTRRVGALPPVLTVEVTRSWPNTLRVQVVERRPVAAVPRTAPPDGAAAGTPAGFDLMDDEGVIFRTVPGKPGGIATVRLQQPGPSDPATRSALVVLRALSEQLRAELVTLVVDGPARIRLELKKDRIVTWGDAAESELKAKVATALLAQAKNRIDVSAPEVVTFK